jgi:hypothetical protein
LSPDPRSLDDAAYREQFELARSIEATSARIASATTAAGAMRKALLQLRGDTKGALADTLDRFQARLLELTGEVPAANPANAFSMPPKHIESLRWLSSALGNLQQMVDGADAAPSSDAREGFSKLRTMVESTLVAWQRFATTELESLNGRLRAAGMKPITLAP